MKRIRSFLFGASVGCLVGLTIGVFGFALIDMERGCMFYKSRKYKKDPNDCYGYTD